MNLREIAIGRKARKSTAAGITADGAYWIPVKISIYIGGGDGIGQSRPVIEDSLVVRHYRSGELRAYAERESWHHDRGSSYSRMRRDTLLDCATIEEIVQILESIPLESGEYETGNFSVTPKGRERLCAGLGDMPAMQPGPDEAFTPLRTFFCHGCGEEITDVTATWHDGDGYCAGCENSPAEE